MEARCGQHLSKEDPTETHCLLFWLNSSTSTFSPITIFWICRVQLLPQGCGGSLAQSLLHLIQPSLTWSHCVLFQLHYSPACNSSNLSTSSIFSPRAFFWIFHSSLQDEDKEGSLPHQVLLFTFFFCWNVHSSSFCTEGPWKFPFPVLAGLKVPAYKVKFVIKFFLPGGNYQQEAVIISSDHTMPHHRWRISLISLHFNFRGQDKFFLINSITLQLMLARGRQRRAGRPRSLHRPFSSSTLQSERQVVTKPAASRDRSP